MNEDPLTGEDLEVLGELGRGGMGRVLRVRHRRWDVEMALKTPLGALPWQRVDDVVAEAEAWMRLGLHTNVVTCLFVRVEEGVPHLFVELVKGGPLSARAARASTAELLDWLGQAAAGLAHTHRAGLVHQDVKPGNILVDDHGIARLTDFGLARALHGGQADVAGATPMFAAPEQFTRRVLTAAADVFALGASALDLFLGTPAWERGPDASSVVAEVLRGEHALAHPIEQPLLSVLAACLSWSAADRPGIDEVAEAFASAAVRAGAPARAPRAIEARADGLVNAAVSWLSLFRADAADALLDEALALDPTHVVARFNRALLDHRRGRLSLVELERRVAPLLDVLPALSPEAAKALLYDELSFFAHAARAARAAGADTGDVADAARLICALAASGDGEGARAVLAARPDVADHPRYARLTADVRADNGKHTTSAVDGRFDSAPLGVMLAAHAIAEIAVEAGGRSCLVRSGDLVERNDLTTGDIEPVSVAMPSAPEARILGAPPILGVDGSVRIGDRCFLLHERPARCAVEVDARRFVSGGDDGRLLLVDVDTGLVDMIWDGHRGPVTCVAAIPGRPFILSGGADGRLCLWGVPAPRRRPGLLLCPPASTAELDAREVTFAAHLRDASTAMDRADAIAASAAVEAAAAVPGYAKSPAIGRLRTRLRRPGAAPVQLWEALRIPVDGVVACVRVDAGDTCLAITLRDRPAMFVTLAASSTRLHAVAEHRRLPALATGFLGEDLVIVDARGAVTRRGRVVATPSLSRAYGADVGIDGTVGIFAKPENPGERFGEGLARLVSGDAVTDRIIPNRLLPMLGPAVPVRAADDVLAVGARLVVDARGARRLPGSSLHGVPAVSWTRRAFATETGAVAVLDLDDRVIAETPGGGALALDATGRLLAHGDRDLTVVHADAPDRPVSLRGLSTGALHCIAFSPSARFVCCGGPGVVILCELVCT